MISLQNLKTITVFYLSEKSEDGDLSLTATMQSDHKNHGQFIEKTNKHNYHM